MPYEVNGGASGRKRDRVDRYGGAVARSALIMIPGYRPVRGEVSQIGVCYLGESPDETRGPRRRLTSGEGKGSVTNEESPPTTVNTRESVLL